MNPTSPGPVGIVDLSIFRNQNDLIEFMEDDTYRNAGRAPPGTCPLIFCSCPLPISIRPKTGDEDYRSCRE